MGKIEDFREIVTRLRPAKISVAKLSRAADIDYNYLQKLLHDPRPGQTTHPQPDKGQKILDALQTNFGVTVTKADRLAMENACTAPREGYRVVPEEYAISYDMDKGARRVAEAYRSAPALIRAAFEALASVPYTDSQA